MLLPLFSRDFFFRMEEKNERITGVVKIANSWESRDHKKCNVFSLQEDLCSFVTRNCLVSILLENFYHLTFRGKVQNNTIPIIFMYLCICIRTLPTPISK